MPTYVYEVMDDQGEGTGEIVELTESVSAMESRQTEQFKARLEDGRIGSRRLDIELGSTRAGQRGYPFLCDAAGVHPSQIKEEKERLAQCGVSADFHPDGRIKMESHAHRKRVLKACGLVDRAGYN